MSCGDCRPEGCDGYQHRIGLSYQLKVSLWKEKECFDGEAAGFLEAVEKTGSMLGACQEREIFYSKAWKLIKKAEDQRGILFLTRQAGGSKGGSSSLTQEGRDFLDRYRKLEEEIERFSMEAFDKAFYPMKNKG